MDRVTNVLLDNGLVAAYDVTTNGFDQTINASGKIVSPGFVDIHSELREPGCEEDETIESGTAAALSGGYTSIACIPNTEPPIDSQASVEFVRQKAARAGNCNVFVLACISKGREGKELAEIGSLVGAGAVGFTDADRPVQSAALLRRALEYCLMFDVPILDHPENLELSHEGVMHEGLTSMVLGLTGMPADAEDVMTARDLRLAEYTGGRLHLLNLSTAGSIELLRRFKSRGLRVTAEVCPPHFTLTDEQLRSFDSNCKVNPPLRSKQHVAACIEGLKDGTIDVIASGHAPRASQKKLQELDQAPFGVVGLETTLGLVGTKLIEAGHLDWPQAIAKMTCNPAKVLGLNKGTLRVGADADLTIIDPHYRWEVRADRFQSRSSNTPFDEWTLTGRAEKVIVGGALKMDRT
jgi:dihydroorotase